MKIRSIILVSIFICFLIPSTAEAQNWDSAKRLTWNPSDSTQPSLDLDSGNNVHIVWHDNGPGNYEIFYRKSSNGGTTWSSAKRLTWNSGDSRNPVIANDSSNNIHVVWDDVTPGRKEIYYRKSTNGGTTWSAAKRLTRLTGNSLVPSMIIDTSNRIHVVWYDITPGNNEIYYTRSTNGGSTWINPKRMTWNPSSSRYPFIATGSGDVIHLVWQDNVPGNEEIYYKKSTNGGTSWLTAKRLTWNSGLSVYPRVTIDSGNNIHLVWADRTSGNYEVFYKKSTNGGTSWPVTKRLTWNTGHSLYPVIATDAGNNIYTAWMDLSPGNYEIYYRRSTNSGGAWTFKRLTWNGGSSTVPEIATYSTGEVHVVWADTTPQNNEIFYRRTETSQPSAPVLSAPSTSTGSFNVTVTYSWPTLASGSDRFELYENNVKIQDSTWGTHPNPWIVPLVKSPGSYTYKARAYVGSGSNPGWTPYSNQKTVTVTAPTSYTRFHNNTVYFIVSLKIDGVEQVIQVDTGLAPGNYYQMELSPGSHSYEAATGIWEYGSRTLFYIYSGTFVQDSGQTENVYFNNPSINYLLTHNNSSVWWNGEWLFPYRQFRFFNNGTYYYYVDGAYSGSGTYSLVSYEPYKVTFSLSSLGANAFYWDVVGGYFSMKFGDLTDQFYGSFPSSVQVEIKK